MPNEKLSGGFRGYLRRFARNDTLVSKKTVRRLTSFGIVYALCKNRTKAFMQGSCPCKYRAKKSAFAILVNPWYNRVTVKCVY